MITLVHFFLRLERLGIKLSLEGDQLKVNVLEGRELTPGLMAELKRRKEEISGFLRRNKDYQPIGPQEKKEYYPVSSAQKRLYVLHRMESSSPVYHITGLYGLSGAIDEARLKASFASLVSRHESLRTSFLMIDHEPVQRVHGGVAFELEVYELEGPKGHKGQKGQELIELVIQRFVRPFDLGEAPLLRVGLIRTGDEEQILLVDMHHIVSDGTSVGVLISEFTALYRGEPLPPLHLQYKDFVGWQASPGQREELSVQEAYWLAQFPGEIPVLSLPYDYQRPLIKGFSGKSVHFEIDKTGTKAIKSFALRENVTLYLVLLAAYYALLSRLSGQEDVVIGTPVAGRRHTDLEGIIGMFVNTLALRNFPVGDKPFRVFLQEVKSRVFATFQNQDYPLETLLEKLAVQRNAGRNALFDVMFALQDFDMPWIEIGELRCRPHEYKNHTAKFDLSLVVVEANQRLKLTLEYSNTLFKEETIDRFSRYYRDILHNAVFDPDQELGGIAMMTGAEQGEILAGFNGTVEKYPGDKTLPELFIDQVERTPAGLALKGPGPIALLDKAGGANNYSPPHCYLSYSELDRRASALAGALIEKGVLPNTIVGLQVERSLDMIIGILGILKAGGAYLPIDPEAPPERVDYMLADSGAEIVIGPQTVGANCCSPIQDIGAECKGERQFAPTDLAYVIYTSGSTGRPKGVPIGHHNLCPLLHWGYRHIGINPDDRLAQNLSFYFDWSVWEIFITLTSGALLCLVDRETLLDGWKYTALLNREKITVLHITPTQYQYLVASGQKLPYLRILSLGAEKLSVDLVQRSFSQVSPECRVFNMYGPTEATIMAAVLEIDRSRLAEYGDLSSVPIGRSISNTGLLILNRYRRLCPVKVAGELFIAGDGLAGGYLNNPELTAEKFISAPLHGGEGMGVRLDRLYKTGDLARWLEDGSIEFLGRVDFQVKIRGLRIELGEIETQLRKHPAIKEAVVLVRQAGEGDPYLCAYLVMGPGQAPGKESLRRFLSEKMPAYMLPAQFINLEKIPLTANGKIDRQALFASESDSIVGSEYISPSTGIEKKLVEIWADVLKNKKSIGIHDNFFDLGGNSLSLVRLAGRLKGAFNREIPVVALFNYPTVAAQAGYFGQDEREDKPGRQKHPVSTRGVAGSDIAVIGMAGRFPGAANIDEFWDNLKQGVESITILTKAEALAMGATEEWVNHPGYVAAKGILEKDGHFDAYFFDYTPAEVRFMDPQVRFFHECCWEALENAGYEAEGYPGLIGLYAGASANPYWEFSSAQSMGAHVFEQWQAIQFITRDFLTTRIGYKLGLKGPCVAVQTACSTSLVAIDFACQGLWNGRCHMALAGGVSVTMENQPGYIYQEGMIMSPDGHCRAFDEKARGLVAGNGGGVVVLKPLPEASADGDHIYAVIKGVAVNNDGNRKVGYTAPSIVGQVEVIRAAREMAGIDPDSIGYIEAHGTGTILGDPIEIEALTQAFRSERKGYCAIGSVKTNIGHLDAAAGIAGFIKTVLCLEHRLIPPSLHFQVPNPAIDFANSPFYVNGRLQEWKREGGPLRAGVSSFGIGGTNAHVILEEAPDPVSGGPSGKYQVLMLSARSKTALEKMTGNLTAYLGAQSEKPTGSAKAGCEATLADIAYTLHVGRRAWKYRRVFIGASPGEIVSASAIDGEAGEGDKPVMFMFPGLGSEYVNMGRELYERQMPFRQEMDRCFEILRPLLGRDLKTVLYPDHGSKEEMESAAGEIHRAELAPPAIFILSVALARLMMRWGVKPQALIGYSFGEYAAACVAGVFSLEDALRVVVGRSQLLEKAAPGAMSSVPLMRAEVEPRLVSHPQVSLAIDNGESFIVAGLEGAVAEFEQEMKRLKAVCMRVPVHRALHSRQMDEIAGEFEKLVGNIRLHKPFIPFVSNVSGDWIRADEVVRPGYWSAHLRQTVRFGDGLKALLQGNDDSVLVEVGPGRDLSAMVSRFVGKSRIERVINLVRRETQAVSDEYYLLNRLGRMWVQGVKIAGQEFYAGQKRRRQPLPTYPFERQPVLRAGTVVEITPVKSVAEPGLYPRPHLATAYQAPGNEREQTLAHLWQDSFGIGPIGIDDDFFELGGDSLKALVMVSKLLQAMKVDIPIGDFFRHSTIRRLSRYISGHRGLGGLPNLDRAEKKEYYPLSSAQKRIFLLQQLDREATGYNMPAAMTIQGKLGKEKLTGIFQRIIRRHESLRTSFLVIGHEPVQQVLDQVGFELEVFAADGRGGRSGHSGQELELIVREFIRPFDLSRAPLLRVGLVKSGEESHILLIDMHHIVSDGVSLNVLIREFMALYGGQELAELPIQYRDYAEWQNRERDRQALKKQEKYWLSEFGGEIPALNLPTDFTRPAVQSFSGASLGFIIGKEDTDRLKTLAIGQGSTLFMVLLSIFNLLMTALSGQEDIVVGTPTAGRKYAELQALVGMFVNTLPLRNFPVGDKTFKDFLQEVKNRTIAAFENQEYQFEELVERLDLRRDTSRNPLFDVMFVLQNLGLADLEVPGLLVNPYAFDSRMSKFDLTVQGMERAGELDFYVEYCTSLFTRQTIGRFVSCFQRVVAAVLQDIDRPISALEIIPDTEKEEILCRFNRTKALFPVNKRLDELFSDQVTRTPAGLALKGPGPIDLLDKAGGANNYSPPHCYLSYSELDRRASALAGALIEKGVLPNTIVGLQVERSLDMIIGILGILKAGGAYLPIDPEAPPERVDYMLADSGAEIVIGPQTVGANCCSPIQDIGAECKGERQFAPTDLSYVIYTSGSTGRPKGVPIGHQELCPLLHWGYRHIGINPDDRLAQNLSFYFDWSVWEIFIALTSGALLCLVDRETLLDGWKYTALLNREKITVLHITPTQYQYLVASGQKLPYLRILSLGAEKLSVDLVQRSFSQVSPECRVFNMYGPTEATIMAAVLEIDRSRLPEYNDLSSVPIGRSISNTGLLILDRYRRLCPVKVAGELFIAGDGLAGGYLNNPELTAEKFISAPLHGGEGMGVRLDRLYKTGDLARWLEDGSIEFLGRVDFQVKIRGFRIELGEIETQLRKHPAIKEAVVLVRQAGGGETYLCAYLVMGPGQTPEKESLHRFLAKNLPVYMIPAYFIDVPLMPLNPNGKIDIEKLPAPEIGIGRDFIPPGNEVEYLLVEIWSEILDVPRDKISIDADFFELGGHSLKAVLVQMQIEKRLDIYISSTELFKTRTIQGVASLITAIRWVSDELPESSGDKQEEVII